MKTKYKKKNMKKMNLDEYKKKKIEVIVLPSGLEVEVNGLTPYHLLQLQTELKIKFDENSLYSSTVVEWLFAHFLHTPKVPDDLKVEDFERNDYIKLHELIFEGLVFPEEESKE